LPLKKHLKSGRGPGKLGIPALSKLTHESLGNPGKSCTAVEPWVSFKLGKPGNSSKLN